ncbi:hypothetical protein H7J76_34445 [Mycolicibacterium fortuitum]|nr:hypothetical protein [Mycolicibacterium fortuitum]
MHRDELAGAISRIARRRATVDDVHRDRLPDAADSDPREVLRYLRQFSGTDIPRWVLQADVCDALILNNWLWWEDRRTELHFLLEGRRRGLFLDQLGAQVGVGKQGVRDRIDRLEALLRFDRPNEKLTRAARAAAKVADQRRTAEDAWIENHQAMLREAIAELLEQASRLVASGEDRDWLDELAVDTGAEGDLGRTIMPILGLAVDELRTSPAVLALPSTRPPHPIREALARCDALRAAFAAETAKPADRGQKRSSEASAL